MAWDQRVPFTEEGSLCSYVYSGGKEGTLPTNKYARKPVTWKDNHTFEAVLKLEGTTRGQSAARFIWSDEENRLYEMFISDMAGLVKSGAVIERGCCGTKWTFTKKGQNYGIKVAK